MVRATDPGLADAPMTAMDRGLRMPAMTPVVPR